MGDAPSFALAGEAEVGLGVPAVLWGLVGGWTEELLWELLPPLLWGYFHTDILIHVHCFVV